MFESFRLSDGTLLEPIKDIKTLYRGSLEPPEIVRYDGTRYMDEEDVDREFLGRLVLLDAREFPNGYHMGYLYAVTDDTTLGYHALADISIEELEGKSSILVGCESRGWQTFYEILGGVVDG